MDAGTTAFRTVPFMSDIGVREPVAVIGTGLVGRSWAVVFARAGHQVALFDTTPGAANEAVSWARTAFVEMGADRDAAGLEELMERIRVAPSQQDAVRDAVLVQECTREVLTIKQTIMTELDRDTPSSTILASSTSTIPASRYSEGLAGRGRCLVAHPTNPPHLVPLVEIVPAPWTDSEIVTRARDIYASAGQVTVVLRAEIDGFILNRLQVALLQEAYRLYEDGIASAEDIDKTVRDGLGLRWSFMGPFETIDLNAAGGLSDFVAHLGPVFDAIAATQVSRPWSSATVQRLHEERRAALPLAALPGRQARRDRRLALLRSLWETQDDV